MKTNDKKDVKTQALECEPFAPEHRELPFGLLLPGWEDNQSIAQTDA